MSDAETPTRYDPIAIVNEKMKEVMEPTGVPPRVTPRHIHDYMWARELVRGITYELEGEVPFRRGQDGDEVTKELYDYVTELRGIVSRYYPKSSFDPEADE